MISTALIASIILASSAFIVAYGLGVLWLPTVAILVLGVAWILAPRAAWPWLPWVMMTLLVVIAAVGAWLALRPVPLVVGLVAAVSAWDLDLFVRQLRRVDRVERGDRLKRRHLRRLVAVDGVGLLMAILALTVEIQLTFALALGLGLAALVGLSRLIVFLRQETG